MRWSEFGFCLLLLGCTPQSSAPTGSETVISEFSYPWSDKPVPRTEFRAHTDGERLHFAFDVDDADIVVTEPWGGESTLDGEDRVELFFAKDAELRDYWCIEVDPLGRTHDYHAQHYRKFDSTWNCPGLQTTGERTATGYTVRGSLPLTTLSDLLGQPVTQGSSIRLGLFRAEFYGQTTASHGEARDNWISWVRPSATEPDFHTPSAFKEWSLP